MKKEKVILLFSDLEGTILREEDGQFDPETMYQFLGQLEKLQELTGAKVNIHLVSPVYKNHMAEVMDKIDRTIIRYNKLHEHKNDIECIEGGAAYPDNLTAGENLDDRITELKRPISSTDFDTARFGKANYVRNWCEIIKESQSKELVMAMYCGNGRNDVDAMDYIIKKSGALGFVVCPDNSRHEVKAKTPFVSKKRDLLGITDGISMVNKEIEKRKNPNKDEQNKDTKIH